MTAQRRLVTLGLYDRAVDGIVGWGTRHAVREFQRGAGLKVDGKITPELLRVLDDAVRRFTTSAGDAS